MAIGNSTANANAFANNFMTGFAFVDQIKSRKRSEARLDARLAEEKEERAFQRRRTLESDSQVRENRAFVKEDRARVEETRGLREEGQRAALNPDTPIDELIRLSPHSPAAAAEAKRQIGEDRFKDAMRDIEGIPTASAAPQSLSAGVTGLEQRGDPVAEQAPAAAASPAPASNANTFAPDRGRSGQHRVSEEEFNTFSEDFQDKNTFSKALDVIGGQFSQTARAAEDLVGGAFNAPGRIRGAVTGEDINPAAQNIGQEFSGEVNVPAEWTTVDEFESLTAEGAGEAAIQEATQKNKAIAAKYELAGSRPQSMSLDSYSRQGAVLQESDTQRRAAIQHENRAIKLAKDFLDPGTSSALNELAAEDPKAAAVMYMEVRATLEGVDQNLMSQMDRRMVPVLNEAESGLQAELIEQDPGAPNHRRQISSLRNLQASRDTIARGQPSISSQAGINEQGLKVGDTERVNQVLDTIYDPERPLVTQHRPASLLAAATITGRITPKQRVSDRQLSGLAVLAEGGWIDKPTAFSVMTTGAWPPTKDPNGIKSIQSAGGTVFAIHENGGVSILPSANDKPKGKMANRELTEENMGWAMQGALSMYPGMDDARKGQFVGLMTDHADWIRQRYNVTSQEQMRSLGRYMTQSVFLASAEMQRREDSWFSSTKDSPTPEEIFMQPELAQQLASDLDFDLLAVPPVQDTSGIDVERARQGMREGRWGPSAAGLEEQLTDKQVLDVIVRNAYMEEQRANAQGN